jgi:hypothetical protein
MHRLKHNGGWVTEHEQKEHIVHEHFSLAMGRGPPTSFDLNWESLNLGNGAMEEMERIDAPITGEAVHKEINQMPSDKAPGTDSFTRAFFKKCLGIIQNDVTRAIIQFNNLHDFPSSMV